MTDNNPNSGDPAPSPASFSKPADQGDGPKTFALSEDDIQKILKRNSHAQSHIETIEAENKEMRRQIDELNKKLETSKGFEDLLEGLANPQYSSNPTGQTASPLDKNELLRELKGSVLSSLQEEQTKAIADKNFNDSFDYVSQKFGDQYERELLNVSTELGLSMDHMDNLARTSPTAFKKVVESVRPSSKGNPFDASQNSLLTNPQMNQSEYFNTINQLRRSGGEGSREAKATWQSEEFQRNYRQTILAKAKKEGSSFGNQI